MKYTKGTQKGNVNYDQLSDDDNNEEQKASTSIVSLKQLVIIHAALILAQTLFGGGSIIGKLGLPNTNPVLFALIREGIAGPLLCIIAYAKDRDIPKLSDLKLFILPGLCLFLNQFCFIVGLNLSSSIQASAWQPSQGILAVIYGFIFGIERKFDKYKVFGILIGTAGALFMILYDNHDSSSSNSIWADFGGSIMFFLNCSATVMYLILSKPVFKKYPTSTITGYSYIVASILMVFAALIVANVPSLLNGVCPTGCSAWHVPTVTIYALIYWILCESVAAYLLITWANRWADPSLNLAYTVLQPLTAVIMAEVLIIFNIVPVCHNKSSDKSNCIYGADWNDLGAIGIAFGLLLVIYSSRLQQKENENDDDQNVIIHYN
mmetsp:Transcript_42389/g.37643  ORF Transcript_42389/g.37643 Transcript_42389/m.37643 type:complete len:378 (-) Transcript_42389:11-1144(-)